MDERIEQFRSVILERMKELEWWCMHRDPDPRVMVERSAEIVAEIAQQAQGLGRTELVEASRLESDWTEPELALAYLACCLAAVRRKGSPGFPGKAGSAESSPVPSPHFLRVLFEKRATD